MIEVGYHDSAAVLQGLSLQSDAVATCPFDRPEWFELLEKDGLEPIVAIAKDGNYQLALPLMWDGDVIKALRTWYSFTWRPLGADGAVSLLVAIARGLRSRSHRVVLEPVPDDSGAADWIADCFQRAGWRVDCGQSDTNHYLDVGGRSFDEFWAARPGKLRTTAARRAKMVDIQILSEFQEEAWNSYEAIYAASWKPAEDRPKLLRDFARAEGKAGHLRLGIAHFEGKPVAAQFWTVENRTAYIHKLAHLEEHKRLSAGTTLTAALFKTAIDIDKCERIDFGTGNEPYKLDWMESMRPLYRIDCINPHTPRGWVALARRSASRQRAHLA